MFVFDVRNKPNRARVVFDLGIPLLAAVFVAGFWQLIVGRNISGGLLVSPIILVLSNAALGIYSRHRLSSGKSKLILLSGSIIFASAILFLLLGEEAGSVFLWATLIWSPLTLPRVFLNYNRRSSSGLISDVVAEKGPVLVIGGAGYIGSTLIDQLVKEGTPVRILDKFLYGRGSLESMLKYKNVEIVDGDVTDLAKLAEAMNGVNSVVHLAGLVGDPACAVDEPFTRHTNVIATRMIYEVGSSLGVRRFIFASSCSVYGTSETEVDETSALNPVSLYAQTKIDSEQELKFLANESLCVTILRFATVFGHSHRPRFDLVANLFTAQAFNDGVITVVGEDQWRPFVHVSDLARAINLVLKANPKTVYRQTFNVGDSDLNLTIGQLAQIVKETVSKVRPVEIIYRRDIVDNRNYHVSFEKIRRALNFRASVGIRAGIEEMVQEFSRGNYRDFREAIYSNLEMTKLAVVDFHNPDNQARLYGPLSAEHAPTKSVVNL